jgi:hypothetical protein
MDAWSQCVVNLFKPSSILRPTHFGRVMPFCICIIWKFEMRLSSTFPPSLTFLSVCYVVF